MEDETLVTVLCSFGGMIIPAATGVAFGCRGSTGPWLQAANGFAAATSPLEMSQTPRRWRRAGVDQRICLYSMTGKDTKGWLMVDNSSGIVVL